MLTALLLDPLTASFLSITCIAGIAEVGSLSDNSTPQQP